MGIIGAVCSFVLQMAMTAGSAVVSVIECGVGVCGSVGT